MSLEPGQRVEYVHEHQTGHVVAVHHPHSSDEPIVTVDFGGWSIIAGESSFVPASGKDRSLRPPGTTGTSEPLPGKTQTETDG